jgi:hypothetical protein
VVFRGSSVVSDMLRSPGILLRAGKEDDPSRNLGQRRRSGRKLSGLCKAINP